MSSASELALTRHQGGASELIRLRRALSASGQAVFEWDRATDRITWSEAAADALGLTDADLPQTGAAFTTRLEPDAAGERVRSLEQAWADRSRYHLEYRFGTAAAPVWLEEHARCHVDPDGARRVIGIVRAVTERKRREKRLIYMAYYDELTGHLTRSRLREALSEAILRATRQGSSGAFLLVGIDNLAMINQAYGFEVADEVVARVAGRIEAVAPTGLFGRHSGNKFGMVLSGPEAADLQALTARILEGIRGAVIETGAGPVAATVSVGGVLLPNGARTSRIALRHAQEALEQAREAGGDSAIVYRARPEQDQARRRDLRLARDVVDALNESRLVLAYQPIVDARSGQLVEHECLLRLRQTDGNLVAASEFIPTAEKLGLVRLVDRRALHLAIEALAQHRSARLSLNVSALSAGDPNWLSALLAMLEGKPDIAPRLTVEITETMALRDLAESERFVGTLRGLGCKVALDDFGAGYTSFRHLKALSVDTVKIDGSYIRGLADSRDNQVFVRALVELAGNFAMATVAENVGSEAEAALLRGYGVELLQGYYFGRPDITPPWAAEPARVALEPGH